MKLRILRRLHNTKYKTRLFHEYTIKKSTLLEFNYNIKQRNIIKFFNYDIRKCKETDNFTIKKH